MLLVGPQLNSWSVGKRHVLNVSITRSIGLFLCYCFHHLLNLYFVKTFVNYLTSLKFKYQLDIFFSDFCSGDRGAPGTWCFSTDVKS